MISPRVLSFFAFVYAGIILTTIAAQHISVLYAGDVTSLAIIFGAVVTTAGGYSADKRLAAWEKTRKGSKPRKAWFNDLLG